MQLEAISAVHRSDQAWYEAIAERETLDFALAFHAERFGDTPEANQLREVSLAEIPIERAWESCERFYDSLGLRCRRWSPMMGQEPAPLEPFLAARNFHRDERQVMLLTAWTDVPAPDDVRVVPARAVRAAYGGLCGDLADMALEHLDDPQLDMFAALVDNRPAGSLGLYQVGDIGRIRDLRVASAHRGRGVEAALMKHVLALTRRLLLRAVCAECAADDADARALYDRCGFSPAGSIVRFERPAT